VSRGSSAFVPVLCVAALVMGFKNFSQTLAVGGNLPVLFYFIFDVAL
jgi:hypothetical protein